MSNPRSIPAGSRPQWIPDPRDLSETPGGTLYAMTPGGTKITYNREMLLMLQQSPLSKSPMNLSAFPGLSKGSPSVQVVTEPELPQPAAVATTSSGDHDMFPMEDH